MGVGGPVVGEALPDSVSDPSEGASPSADFVSAVAPPVGAAARGLDLEWDDWQTAVDVRYGWGSGDRQSWDDD